MGVVSTSNLVSSETEKTVTAKWDYQSKKIPYGGLVKR